MPDILVVGLVALVAGLVGFGIALLLRRSFALASETAARANSERLVAEARAKQKEIILEAKDEALKVAKAAETENRERRAELQRFESRLDKKDEQLDQKVAQVEERDRRLGEREAEVDAERTKTVQIQEEQRTELARVASLTMDEARALLLQRVEEEVRDLTNRKVRELEAEARERADERARDIITMALQRYAAEHTAEHSVTVVALPSDDMKGRIIGREGRNIRAIEAATGVDLIIDDTPEVVVISCHNPIRRELARLALERLVSDGRIHPGRIEEVVRKAEQDLDAAVREAGQRAVLEVGVHGIHPELVKLIGMLKYRYSYAQNVLMHSIEAAFIAGAMAAELGLNEKQARRAALLHDIGKALTHEVEGSHAIIGGEIARKYGESAKIVNAIAAHHEEVRAETILAPLVDAADALSGARPGARREVLESYVKRLEDLERISSSFRGVEKSFAVQAGREIRIIVDPGTVPDDQAALLARDVARKIEQEMTYPGQIKVTVIRETRASDLAR